MTNSSAPTEQQRSRTARLKHALDVANTRVDRMTQIIKRLQEENSHLTAKVDVLEDRIAGISP